MKEARIDTILQSITKTLLVYLPEQAVEPGVFYEENYVRRDEIGIIFLILYSTFSVRTYFHIP